MKQFFYWLLLIAVFPLQLIAQNNSIKGKVTDATGAPLLGVSIMINTPSGQRSGTTTNRNGEFTVTAPNNATGLEFSFTGMENHTEPIAGRNILNVQMAGTSAELQQVIVVGYGTQKKVNLTGAVEQVSGEVLENRAVPNLSQGLQGVIPNLNRLCCMNNY